MHSWTLDFFIRIRQLYDELPPISTLSGSSASLIGRKAIFLEGFKFFRLQERSA